MLIDPLILIEPISGFILPVIGSALTIYGVYLGINIGIKTVKNFSK